MNDVDIKRNLCERLEIVADDLFEHDRRPMGATVQEAIEFIKKTILPVTAPECPVCKNKKTEFVDAIECDSCKVISRVSQEKNKGE